MQPLTQFNDALSAANQVHSSQIQAFCFTGNPTNVKPDESVYIRASILEQKYGLENFRILKAVKPAQDNFNSYQWRAALEYVLGKGIEHNGKNYKIFGASSSLKDGKYWLAKESLIPQIHSYFKSAQEALSYFGIFTSSCYHGIHYLDFPIRLVEDGNFDTGDGMGYIPVKLLAHLKLPIRQIQVRFVGESWLGKGTLLPGDVDEFILPKSMIKGKGIPDGKPYYFGIRDIAQKRKYSSNFTVAQWFPKEVHDELRPVVDKKLRMIDQALSTPEHALAFLGLLSNKSEENDNSLTTEVRTTVEAFLRAGISPKHRWIHHHLKSFMRKAYIELASGSGIELTGLMMAYADLKEGEICASELPEGRLVISRYPIRDRASFVVVRNNPKAVKNPQRGTVFMNESLAKQLDGDFDGDYAILCTQRPIIRAVSSSKWQDNYQRVEAPAKERRSDPFSALPFVAAESIGNSIGYVTYLISACVAEEKHDYIPMLSSELQAEVQKLKWNTSLNWRRIEDVSKYVKIPEYLSWFKTDKELFVRKAKRLQENSVIAQNYNYVVDRWHEHDSKPEPLINFRHLIPLWSDEKAHEYIPEVKAVVHYYNKWINQILSENPDPDYEKIRPAIEFLRAWSDAKTENRESWAVALWSVVHESRSSISSGSAAFLAFQDEMISLLKNNQNGLLKVAPYVQGQYETNSVVFEFNGKKYLKYFSDSTIQMTQRTVEDRVLVLPLVGGYYQINLPEPSAQLSAFRRRFENLEKETTIVTREHNNDVYFFAQNFCLGKLPKDHDFYSAIEAGQSFIAHLSLKARTVYAMILQSK